MASKMKAAAAAVKAANKLGKNKSECVQVCVRIRPLSTKERQDGRAIATKANHKTGEITVDNPRADGSEPPKKFTFDHVFGMLLSCLFDKHRYPTCFAHPRRR